MSLAFRGTLCHTPNLGGVEVLKDNLLVVNSAGFVTHIGPADDPQAAAALQQEGIQPQDVRDLGPMQFLLPGFIDCHFHAPQYAFAGAGTDLPLFDWLNTYTFPCEAAFADRQHAQRIYTAAVTSCLNRGTTTCNFFTTLHSEACKVLADVVEVLGQRAVIGKCCMDQHSPQHYQEPSAEHSLQGARDVAAYIKVGEGGARGGETATRVTNIMPGNWIEVSSRLFSYAVLCHAVLCFMLHTCTHRPRAAAASPRQSSPASSPPAHSHCWRALAGWHRRRACWCTATSQRACRWTTDRGLGLSGGGWLWECVCASYEQRMTAHTSRTAYEVVMFVVLARCCVAAMLLVMQ